MILRILDETRRVAWGDICYLRRNLATLLMTAIMTPLLYFIAFGYGLGRGMTMDGVDYVAFVIPGIVALSTLTSCFSSTANKIMVQRRFYSSFDEILLCPISPSAVVLGKTTVGFFKGLLCSFILLGLGMLMSPDIGINPMLILSIAVSCLTFSLLGVLAGFLVDGLPKMNLFNSFVILPMTFLCGTLFTVSALPQFAQWIISVLPLTPAASCIRASALGWDFPYMSLMIVVAFAIVFFAASWVLLKKGRV